MIMEEDLVMQKQIEERKALIQQEKERLRVQREQREKEQAVKSKMDKEAFERKQKAYWENIIYGLSESQIKTLERLIEIEPKIGSNEELHAEYIVLMTELIKGGRCMGEMVFTPHIYYASKNGGVLLIPDGQGNFTLREGCLGSFDTTDKILVNDPNTKLPSKITQPASIPKSNIQLPNVWTVKIEDTENTEKTEPKKTGILNRLKFQSKEQLEKDVRPLTIQEQNKNRLL